MSVITRRAMVSGSATQPVLPAIAISADDNTVSMVQGNTAVIRYTITRTDFTGVVTPTLNGLSSGVTGVFAPTTFTGATTYVDLTLTASAGATVVSNDAFTVDFSGTGITTVTNSGTVTVTSSSVTHYGTATLPTTTPNYTPTNSYTSGTVHYPLTPANLNTLLTGGTFSGNTLAAGDTIVLARGTCYNNATYTSHRFGYISGADANPILVITSDTASIAAPGERITTAQLHATPHFRCQTNNISCILFDGNAASPSATSATRASKGWCFVGIQIDAGSVTSMYGIIRIGPISEYGARVNGTTYPLGALVDGVYMSIQAGNLNHATSDASWWRKIALADLADNIIFDRCHIQSVYSNQVAQVVYCAAKTVVGYGCVFHGDGRDGVEDKAFSAIDAAGPFLFDNCQFTASGITMLTGGANPSFTVQPEDVTFRKCWFYKPTYMLRYHLDWDGNARIHKNLFEFKVVRRALVEDCLFENGYDGNTSQYYSIVFKVSNGSDSIGQQGFDAAETCDITFRYNRLKNVAGVWGLAAMDRYNNGPALIPCHDFSIYQNYTETPAGSINNAGASNFFIQISSDVSNNVPDSLHFEHNTLVGDHPRVDIRTMLIESGGTVALPTNMVWRNNVADFGNVNYGGFNTGGFAYQGSDVFGGTGSSAAGSLLYTPGASIPSGKYNNPPFYRSTVEDDIYVDRTGGDYHTATARAGTGYNSETPGADIDTIDTRTAGCATGVW